MSFSAIPSNYLNSYLNIDDLSRSIAVEAKQNKLMKNNGSVPFYKNKWNEPSIDNTVILPSRIYQPYQERYANNFISKSRYAPQYDNGRNLHLDNELARNAVVNKKQHLNNILLKVGNY